jgi:outer membrane lipoprotein SlyB
MENKYNNDLSKAIGSFGNLYEAKKLSVDGRTKEGRLYKKRSKQLCKYAGKLDIANKHKGVLLGLVSEGMYAANNVDYGLANYLDLGKGMVDEVGSLAEDLGISKKYLDHKRFKALSNKIGVGTSLMGLGKSVNNVFDGDVTMQDGLNVAHGALGTITSVQNTKIGKKLLNKIPKLNKMIGKGRKFLGFIQKIVGVIDSGILSNPFKFASIAADAIGGFITNITGQIGGKVIASTIAAVTGGLGALLYPVTSYFGDMLVSWGITSLYNRYAKPPILQRIQIFAQKSLGSIEKNYPILAHLINGRYMSFFKGMLSYINPKAIFNFIDSFMSKKFPVVWSGVKKASEFFR